jgi:ribosomal protein L12E/L44/L45/RPP1/RPP2
MRRLDSISSNIGRSAKTARLMDAILDGVAPRNIDAVVKMLRTTAPPAAPTACRHSDATATVTPALLLRLSISTPQQRAPKQSISARITRLADHRLREISRRARVSQTIEMILDLVVALHEGRALEDVLSDITEALHATEIEAAREHAEHPHQPAGRH